MKMKVNFSGAAIGQFFANNGEKMVLAITVLVLALFIYGAIMANPLASDKPREIERESAAVKTRVNEVPWDKKKNEDTTLQATNFAATIDEGAKPVEVARLEQTHPWDPPLFPELIKRSQPEIFPVQELRVTSGWAMVAYQPAAAAVGGAGAPGLVAGPGGRGFEGPGAMAEAGPRTVSGGTQHGFKFNAGQIEPQAKWYAILTGLVPLEKQAAEYRRRFEYAVKDNDPGRGAGADDSTQPAYQFCYVERAEVKDANDKNLNWVRINPRAAVDDMGKWAQVGRADIIDPAYAMPEVLQQPNYITWPLPPLLLKDWGLEASHPRIPLYKAPGATVEPTQNQKQDFDPEDRNAEGATHGGLRNEGAGVPTANQLRGGMGRGRTVHEGGAEVPAGPKVPHALFRFVDLTAEPGKTYRYRVQLLVHNPNYNARPQFLDKIETGKSKFLLSVPTEMTPPITIPSTAEALVDTIDVKAPDAYAKLNLLALLTSPVAEVLSDQRLWIGGVAHFRGIMIKNVVDVAADQVKPEVGPTTLNADDMLLLDLRNDNPLGAGKSKTPSEMLFMEPSGRLVIASSAADRPVAEDYRKRTELATLEGDQLKGHGPATPQKGGLIQETAPAAPTKGGKK